MVFVCCVSGCRNTNKEERMYLFPKDIEIAKKWMDVIGRQDLLQRDFERVRSSYRVCGSHFDNTCTFLEYHNRTNLKYDAFPTLHLPDYDISVVEAPLIPEEDVSSTHAGSEMLEIPPGKRRKISPKLHITRAGIKTRGSLLGYMGVKHRRQLTPQSLKAYKLAKEFQNIARKLDVKLVDNEKRLQEALKFAESEKFLRANVNEVSLKFIISQIKMQPKKSRGRRFSIDDQILSLSLLKQSPKGYKLLRKIFALPSRKTLVELLYKLPFSSGLNQSIIDSLKTSVAKMDVQDRYCCLLFDEIMLEAGLYYNKKDDFIEGFENAGVERKKKLADHAMVFMARGVRSKWKQPIAFYFVESSMNAVDMARNLKTIIIALNDIGLHVLATICDQHSTNAKAIRYLKENYERESCLEGKESRLLGFSIGGKEVIPLYDPPHLLKGIRNNMLNSNVQFKWKSQEQVAKWDDVIKLYELDTGDYDTKMCNRLTEAHVYPTKIKKMKVKIAAQVFSQRFSSVMRGLAKFGGDCLPKSAADTADFLLFADKLFDSVNGSAVCAQEGKTLRCAVSASSPHMDFWKEAIHVLKSIKFCSKEGRKFVPPTIINWITTLQGFIYIWNMLKHVGFDYLCPRNFNQDPLENFFGCMRSHGVRNTNPTCTSFTYSYKSLLINNFMAVHSPSSNCEIDDCEGALNTLKGFITSIEIIENVPNEDSGIAEVVEEVSPFTFTNYDKIVISSHSYIAGYMAKTILKTVKSCQICKGELISDYDQEEHNLINARAYSPRALLRPHTNFIKLFGKCNDIIHYYLPKLCTENNISTKLISKINIHIKMTFKCQQHNLFQIFVTKFVNFYLFMWTKNINNILKGRNLRGINDEIKLLALQKYKKLKAKKRKITQEKQLFS